MKNKLLLLFTISLTTLLSACGTNAKTADALPSESESGFYEGTEIKQSFELLEKEITLECGTAFDTDDLSKYIKADNYDNIDMDIYLTKERGNDFENEPFGESYWESMGHYPSIYSIVFTDTETLWEETMTLIFNDTIAPVITLKGSNEITYYQLTYDELQKKLVPKELSENLPIDLYYESQPLSLNNYFSLIEDDESYPLKSADIIVNDKTINNSAYRDIDIIKEFPDAGTYTIELALTDWGDNISTVQLQLNIIEDIAPAEKEFYMESYTFPEDYFQTLYNNYTSQK